MDFHLQSPCNICASINRNSSLRRRFPSPNTVQFPSKFRLKPTSELQTPVAAATPHTISPSVPTHKVTVHDRQRDVVHEFFVPERGLSMGLHYFSLLGDDEVIRLKGLQEKNHLLPPSCCCTSCAVRIKSGEIRQPEALGISAELKAKGYALLCVSYPTSDIEVETQDEDEVYWLQFGRYFARGPIERDDYALELAMGDE